jgi:hypothetical protein
MTRRVRGPSAVWLDDIDLSPYVTDLTVQQDIRPTGFCWRGGDAVIDYRRPETTVILEGLWDAEIDRRLQPIAPFYAVFAPLDGPVTFRVEWTVGDITANATFGGQRAYTFTLPVPNTPHPPRLTVMLDDRPAPVEPAFTVTPWETRRLTPEERQAREQREQRLREDQARARQEKTEAMARARQLLLRHLSDAQRTEFEDHGVITEILPPPYGTARISASTIRLLDDQYSDTTRARYCLIPHTEDYVPPPDDVILARLLLLRYDPERFFRTANQIG